jgi:hypothetical protein
MPLLLQETPLACAPATASSSSSLSSILLGRVFSYGQQEIVFKSDEILIGAC